MGALFVFKNLDLFADKKQRVSIRIRQRFNSVLSSDTHPDLLVKRRQFAKQIAWAFHCILFTDCSMNAHIR